MSDAIDGLDALDDELSDDFRARVKAELDPGERLLWAGRPVAQREPSKTLPVIVGGIAATALVLAITLFLIYLIDPGQPRGFRGDLPEVLKVSLGLLGIVGLFGLLFALNLWTRRLERLKRAGTLYALTDRRAILWEPETWKKGAVKVQTVARGDIFGVHRLEYADGSGDVLFRVKGAECVEGMPVQTTGFKGITKVRLVEEQVRRVLIVATGRESGNDL